MTQNDMIRAFISVAFVLGYFALAGLIFFVGIPAENKTTGDIIFGVMTAGFGQLLNFYFSSSVGSKEKTVALAHALEGKPNG